MLGQEKAYSTRLLGGSELPIAVVHSHHTVGLLALDDLHGHVNLSYVQGRTQRIPARPLYKGYFCLCTQCTAYIRVCLPKIKSNRPTTTLTQDSYQLLRAIYK